MEAAGSAGAGATARRSSRSLSAGLKREPLFHFLILGAVLLASAHWFGDTARPREVVVSADLRSGLRADHFRRTGQWPTQAEEEALVGRYVDDEILYREALALGLDRGDVIVRRRLVQKMGFLIEEEESVPEPSEAELGAFLSGRRERYLEPERVSLEHVFVATDRHPGDADRIAEGLARRIEAGEDPAELGDPFLRGREFRLRGKSEIGSLFGASFASRVMKLSVGAWSPPIRSSYGLHLVRITERRAARLPEIGEIREALRRDWLEERRAEASRRSLARLRDRYDVRVEGTGEAVEVSSSR